MSERRARGLQSFAQVLCLLVATLAPASASPQAPGFDRELSALINAGQIERARAMLETKQLTEAQKLFFNARVLKAAGRLDEAIVVFRQVLDRDPAHLNAKRELAHSLMLIQDDAAAERAFNHLLDIDKNPHMKLGYHQFLNQIQSRRRLSFSGHFALLPSTNINNGTAHKSIDTDQGQFDIAPEAAPQSGIGIEVGFRAQARHALPPRDRVSLTLDTAKRLYSEAAFESRKHHLTLSYMRTNQRSMWSINPYFQTAYQERTGQIETRGLQLTYQRTLSSDLTVAFDARGFERNYKDHDYLDGPSLSGQISMTKQLAPNLSLRFESGVVQSDPKADHQKYQLRTYALGATRDVRSGLRLGLTFRTGQRRHDHDYPLIGVPRSDHFSSLTIGISDQNARAFGLSPSLSCTIRRNESNVAFADFESQDCRLSIARRF